MGNKGKTAAGIIIDPALLETVEQIAELRNTTAQELFENYARQYILENSQELAQEIIRLRMEMQRPYSKAEPAVNLSAPVNKANL